MMLNATLSSRDINKSRNADVVLIVNALFLFGFALLCKQGLQSRSRNRRLHDTDE